MTRHLNLDEQADLQSLTTQIIADGAITAAKISTVDSFLFSLDISVDGRLIISGPAPIVPPAINVLDPRTYVSLPYASLRPEYISTHTTDNFTFPNAIIATTFTIEANGATPPGPNTIGGHTTLIGDGLNPTLSITNGNIDLSFNQALNFRLENVSSDPVSAGHPGRLFWNTVQQTIKVDTGTSFVPLAAVAGAVTGIASDANPYLTGNVQFVSGTGISLSQIGQAITINSTSVSTPGGANTELQYNNGGVFGGIPAVTFSGGSIHFAQNVDFGQYQLKNAALDNVSGTPGGPSKGQFWIDTNDNVAKYWNGTSVIPMSSIGLTAANFVVREVPTGVVNGINTVFTLAFTPILGKEELYLNGVQQDSGAGNDYMISGPTITFTIPPEPGDIVRASYIK